ncbi:TRAP transporter small permease subunit [Marinobacterium sedimentorum]|uniref:TRAP transporter small permease subunit n=1 Tax=Marinobacterium sedimentorum TaxID=2927804 RepID=UPI0020C63F4A|nr:TRAP transporter small permease subunit [Marinobacterium sedimentorum]MCP8686539.1 TRAP transporter small permease subunit [Marinobacterium sedimentorum]
MKGISRFLDTVDGISEFIGKAVSWMCLVMIGVLLYEIAARYFFLSPTSWAHETTTMLYGTFCILAGAYTHRHQAHVRSEVVYHLFSKRGRAILDVITGFIILVVFAVFFYAAFEFALESWQNNEMSSKSTWGPPVYPFKTMLPLGVGLVWLQGLANWIRDIQMAFNLVPTDDSSDAI